MTMEKNGNVTAGELISATRMYNNFDDAARVYDISAQVNMGANGVTGFNGGEVRRRPVTAAEAEFAGMDAGMVAPGALVAEFNVHEGGMFHFNAHGLDGEAAMAVMAAVVAFTDDVKAAVVIGNEE